MNLLRATTVISSLLAHAAFAYPLMRHEPPHAAIAYEKGDGSDIMTVEQGIAIEGMAKLGDAMETIETAAVAPVQPVDAPPPVQEIKPVEELREAVTSEASTVEDNIVKTEEPPPPEVPKPKPPEEVKPEEKPQQVAIISEQSSGAAKVAGDTTARTEYLGKLTRTLETAKVNPRSRQAGTTVVKFKVGTDGSLMWREITTTSGSKVLDEAALAAVDRAAPFPSMPPEAGQEALVLTVPFKFITR